MSPSTREAVRLKLQAHGNSIRLRRVRVLSIAYHLLDAEHMLHVVGDLVRDDVCFRKIARSSEAAVQFFEEGQSRYTF